MIIPIFTPHGGCPERCHFCDQSVSGGTPVAAAKVTATIETHLASGNDASEVAFYGGTFTAMPRERQLAYLAAVQPFLKAGRVRGVRVATRPDAIDEDWLRKLRDDYQLTTVELGVQSFDEEVLRALGRSHTNASVVTAMQVLKVLGLGTSLHLMIGCPDELEDADRETLEQVLRLKPDFVRIHPLLVLKDTALEGLWREGRFAVLDLESAVRRAAQLTFELEARAIGVIRLGLQPNELLGESVVAGPYHPAFGDLVRGRLLRNQTERLIEALLAKELPTAGSTAHIAEIEVSEQLSGTLKGPKKSNLEWLRSRFDLSSVRVRVVQDATPSYDKIKVRLHHTSGPA